LYPDAYTVVREENQMLGRAFLLLTLLWSATTQAGEVVDAAGRNVQMPNQIARVLPAGPPAAILLEVMAPDLILDLRHGLSANRLLGLAWLSGGDPTTLASMFAPVVYGQVLTPAQLGSVLNGTRQIQP
jgi:hypothetical protein